MFSLRSKSDIQFRAVKRFSGHHNLLSPHETKSFSIKLEDGYKGISSGTIRIKSARSSKYIKRKIFLSLTFFMLSIWMVVVLTIFRFKIVEKYDELADKLEEDESVIPKSAKLTSGMKWIGNEIKHGHNKIIKEQLLRLKPDASSLAFPHPRLDVPDFQENMYRLTAKNWENYSEKLAKFAKESLGSKMADWTISRLRSKTKELGFQKPIPKQIWQTGYEVPTTVSSFEDINPDAIFNYFDDAMLEKWVSKYFTGTNIEKAWQSMERIVLKADFWRYLIIFIEGGYYSDTDTTCLKSIDKWGKIDATIWDTKDTFSKSLALGPPLVVVGIEVDVPDLTSWETFWTRPIQIVQWTMAGEPGHPIFLDAMRRVMESMFSITDWQSDRNEIAKNLAEELFSKNKTLKERKKDVESVKVWEEMKQLLTTDPFDKSNGGLINLLEATGPAAFSDAVFSYLYARFGVHWSQLHDIQVATRIGDVAIVPITGFAPFERPDWPRWQGVATGPMSNVGDITHPQALVNHHFSGSWRLAMDDTI